MSAHSFRLCPTTQTFFVSVCAKYLLRVTIWAKYCLAAEDSNVVLPNEVSWYPIEVLKWIESDRDEVS